jgi:2-C-methyl-D-erythritol 4-phosphate cytidylyltransferase
MGGTVSKPYLEVNGRPLLSYTLEIFQTHPLIEEIIVIVQPGDIAYCREEIVDRYGYNKVGAVIAGGKERQDSVSRGLLLLGSAVEWVAVHDGVRPLVSGATITRVLRAAFEKGAAVVGVPVKDTIKIVGADMAVRSTPDRRTVWQVQTPQVFRRELIMRAYEKAEAEGWRGTDDSSLVERLGEKVFMVEGEYSNIKVTTPDDLVFIKEMMKVK